MARFITALLFVTVTSCGYRQHVMFRASDTDRLTQTVTEAERNYVIQVDDRLLLDVYTNSGEQIVDPLTTEGTGQEERQTKEIHYLVDPRGTVKFPLINEINVRGLTLLEAEKVLEKEFGKFYQQPFVKLKFANKRVVVLGATGGQVIPLTDENTRLTEVLALAKGIAEDSKAHNIKIMRGDTVLLADLSTITGYKSSNYIMQPDDIVYVEPIRRPLSEGLRDYGNIFALLSSAAAVVIVLLQVN